MPNMMSAFLTFLSRPSITSYLLAGIEKLGVPVKYYAVSYSSIEILKVHISIFNVYRILSSV